MKEVLKNEMSVSLSACAENSGLEDVYPQFLGMMYKEMVSRGYKHSNNYEYPIPLSIEKRDEIAWALVIAVKVERGINISKKLRRHIGNEAASLQISHDEAWAFAHEVILAVVEKFFSE
ncbi:hypothetical protein A3I18_00180 [Candidatus Campbellbacteria bacterium RIFCSPLOWO2_02_FULL_35_11]|uniref:Uncharacterized protein n=1 Tax=Candidatus Campbellbacteria bacterium RIFCSPLOWO2_02_FULL_35_11 TaxID=1797581 RepID=A0A1F5ERQ8_9BACT|nr:MAG: hypothetical protein A3I18_00180 [Candidatus Campbellbacteria bacterium RIFCSPLOWO2_02_FULL_35_11]